MPRRSQPAKQSKPEPSSIVHRVASTISDWRVLIGAVIGVALFGATAYAFVGKFATKIELATVKSDIQVHNEELKAIHQALEDIRWDVQQLIPKR